MTISSSYGTMQKQIADELSDNTSLLVPLSDSSLSLSPVQNAIQQAIAKWEREDFYFNTLLLETPLTAPVGGYPFQTAIGQEYYSATDYAQIPTLANIKSLWVLVSANRYRLTPRTSQYMQDTWLNPAVSGQPIDYSNDALQLRFGPVPNGVYPLGIMATQRLGSLAADPDSNAWTQDGFDLIRSEAKLQLARDVLNDQEAYQAAKIALYGDPDIPGDRGFVFALKAETNRRRGKSRIMPSYF